MPGARRLPVLAGRCGGRRIRRRDHALVDGEQRTLGRCPAPIQAQEPQGFQGVADFFDISKVPEGQQLQQIGVTDVQPGQTLAPGGRLVQVDRAQLLEHNRFFEPDSRCEFG